MPNRNKAQRKEAQKILKIFRKSRKREGTDEKEKTRRKLQSHTITGIFSSTLEKQRTLKFMK